MDRNFKNTDFFIEDIDKSVKDLATNDTSVTHIPANTDFFIENIDNNVMEIATDRGITPSVVEVVPANTDFFIENIDSNVQKIAEDLGITPSKVEKTFVPTDSFIENIYFNLILICEELSITPTEITHSPANTDFFIEAIADNVDKIMEEQTEIHASGEFIHVVLSADSEITDAEILGNASQSGTPTPDSPVPIYTVTGENTVNVTGKNLIDLATPYRLDGSFYNLAVGTQILPSQDGTSTITQTSTGTFDIALSASWKGAIYVVELPVGTDYYLSGTITSTSNRISRYALDKNYNITRNLGNISASPSQQTLAFQLQAGERYFALAIGSNTQITITAKDIQLELGSTATAYEPYEGQNYEVNLGKNLFDGEIRQGNQNSETGVPKRVFSKGDGIYIYQGETYTFSTDLDTTTFDYNLYIAEKPYLTADNTMLWNSSYRQTASYTFTASYTGYFGFTVRYRDESNIIPSDISDYHFQFEKGSSATAYAPYFTPIELAKIGTYQDRIYKNEGKWYIEKQVGKVVLTGTNEESWNTATNSPYYGFYSQVLGSLGFVDKICDNFTYENIGWRNATTPILCENSSPQTRLLIFAGFTDITNVTGWKSWLESHPTTVYYQLAEPTTTEITDETLLSQLNALLGRRVYFNPPFITFRNLFYRYILLLL